MSRSDLVVGLIALVLVACEQRSDLGGQKLRECSADCGMFDAGQGSTDATVERPDARFMSAPPERVAELVASLEGTWWGFAKEANQIVDDVDQRTSFEISFAPGDAINVGTFRVLCLDGRDCNPFGIGSANPAGGRFTIADLELVDGARGELTWTFTPAADAPPVTLRVPFFDMQRDEAGGPALTFDVGTAYSSSEAVGVTQVVLAFGRRPVDVGMPTTDAPADAGAP